MTKICLDSQKLFDLVLSTVDYTKNLEYMKSVEYRWTEVEKWNVHLAERGQRYWCDERMTDLFCSQRPDSLAVDNGSISLYRSLSTGSCDSWGAAKYYQQEVLSTREMMDLTVIVCEIWRESKKQVDWMSMDESKTICRVSKKK